jgi:hypothetical protein
MIKIGVFMNNLSAASTNNSCGKHRMTEDLDSQEAPKAKKKKLEGAFTISSEEPRNNGGISDRKITSLSESPSASSQMVMDTADDILQPSFFSDAILSPKTDPKKDLEDFIQSHLMHDKRRSADLPRYQVNNPTRPYVPIPQDTYSDQYKLINSPYEIKKEHEAFYINQAALFANEDGVSPEMKHNLHLLGIHGLAKAATILNVQSEEYGLQVSPFVPESKDVGRYYRSSSDNELFKHANQAYAAAMQVSDIEVMLIDNPASLCEAFAREMPGAHLALHSENEFEELIDRFLKSFDGNFIQEVGVNEMLIDITDLLKEDCTPENFRRIQVSFDNIVLKKLERYDVSAREQILTKILKRLHLFAFCKYQEQNILLTPSTKPFDKIMVLIGGWPSPDQIKEAWLKVADPMEMPQFYKPKISTKFGNEKPIPTVFNSYQEFIGHHVLRQFEDLSSSENAPPYLKIMPKAIVNLLKGFQEVKTRHGSIQQFFIKENLNPQLQLLYVGMIEIMRNTILHKEDVVAFNNNMEALHQGIQNILGIVQPYDEEAFAAATIEHFTQGKNPLVPLGLKPNAYLNASGMRSISNIMASVEEQKGTNNLNVLVLKDSYYESTGLLQRAKTYHKSILNGDAFNRIEAVAGGCPNVRKIDLFVCEFHHNTSLARQSYQMENITGQVLALFKKGFASRSLTVAIDCTIGYEQSEEVYQLLNNPEIKALIQTGKLNVALFRSAQKFDMLGMDNYYGGIAVTINNGKSFGRFDARMNDKDDQLKGLSYQGVTHIQKYGNADAYRKAVVANTMKLYGMLPKEMIYSKDSKSLMQISKIEDDSECFLEVKIPTKPGCALEVARYFFEFALHKNLVITNRSSFGFMITNISAIRIAGLQQFRINPGLESEETLAKYAYFLKKTYDRIEEAVKKNPDINEKELSNIISGYWYFTLR